jgi:xanthine dehydrogenase accessory factor
MVVSEVGAHAGSISSGCLERAIIEEAIESIKRGEGGAVRYGKGSRFVDVVLPCGSGVDILFSVAPDHAALAEAKAVLDARNSVSLWFGAHGVSSSAKPERFMRCYDPAIRIVAAGYGPELNLLASLADSAGFEFCALSPEESVLQDCPCTEKYRLVSSSQLPNIRIDERTACVLLFHDREWERALASLFLRSSTFYAGAVGGNKTAAARREMLASDGFSETEINRLSAPIGLVPMTRDPAALAISILAEILARSETLR